MKIYKYKNATIYVYGNVNKERLEKATIQFMKNIRRKADNRWRQW